VAGSLRQSASLGDPGSLLAVPQGGDLTTISDGDLVARCRSGDQAAWNALVERFSRYIYAILTQGFRFAEHDAEDIFQDVFARTWTHLERLRDDDAIRPWLAQLTRRLAIDRIRSGGREQPAEDVAETAELDDTLARLDDALDIRRAMSTLPEHCQEVLDRFFARDESYQTIAAALEIPPGTIASRISRCLSKMKSELEGR
jgi:RNA polymerase sigma factor (sigma-70 family)